MDDELEKLLSISISVCGRPILQRILQETIDRFLCSSILLIVSFFMCNGGIVFVMVTDAKEEEKY